MGKADLHIHTTYSFDGTASVREVLEAAAKTGLDVIAITDHDEVRGGLEACQLAGEYGLRVIPGTEVSTREGHLVALFIEEPITPKLSLVETLLAVGEQGGIGIAAHPDHVTPNSLSLQSIVEALERPQAWKTLHGIEVRNMNPSHSVFNKRSERAAASVPLACIGSSDAHLASMVGTAVTHFDGYTPDDLRRAIEGQATLAEQVSYERAWRVFLRWAKLYHRRNKSQSSVNRNKDSLSKKATSVR